MLKIGSFYLTGWRATLLVVAILGALLLFPTLIAIAIR